MKNMFIELNENDALQIVQALDQRMGKILITYGGNLADNISVPEEAHKNYRTCYELRKKIYEVYGKNAIGA